MNFSQPLSDLIDRHLRLQRLSHGDFELDFTEYSPGFPALQARALIGDAYPGRQVEASLANDLPTQVTMDCDLVTMALMKIFAS